MESISLEKFSKESKILLLNELGYSSDGIFVLDSKGNRVYDKYIKDLVIKIDNMVILPGSTIILDNNPLSIASYIEEFGDDVF